MSSDGEGIVGAGQLNELSTAYMDEEVVNYSPPHTPVRRQIILEPDINTHFLKNKSTIPGLFLDYNRFDQEWEESTGSYVPRTNNKPLARTDETVVDDINKYAFSIVRFFKPSGVASMHSVKTEIQIWSPYWITAAKEVMKDVQNITWTLKPLNFDPDLLLGFLDHFQTYLTNLEKDTTQEDAELIAEHVEFFIRFMQLEYHTKLRQLRTYLSEGCIAWDMIWGLLIPGQIIHHLDDVMRKPCSGRLRAITKKEDPGDEHWFIEFDYLERTDDGMVGWGYATDIIPRFSAVERIENLPVFPLDRHPRREQLEKDLLKRGRIWFEHRKVHHMTYDNVAYHPEYDPNNQVVFKKTKVKSRIILDQKLYRVYWGLSLSDVRRTLDGESLHLTVTKDSESAELPYPPDDILRMTFPYFHGFSLTGKEWLIFDVDCAQEITWNQEAFKNLSLPPDQKQLVESLVESHSQDKIMVDDFVEGKGRGLIISLFGPPGVGKTLTAEATSEHTKRPLYVVGAGEIGSSASDLETNLRRIFAITSQWRAVVLIDEADVFLERRSTADLDRNAIVAVLLRQLEYFPGILFLTTNRQIVFDEALQSRIHVSLYYTGLSPTAKEQIWVAFLKRANVDLAAWTSNGAVRRLRDLPINGRQIKNSVNTATVLARHKKEELGEAHVWQVIRINEEYGADSMRKKEALILRRRRTRQVILRCLVLALLVVVSLRFTVLS